MIHKANKYYNLAFRVRDIITTQTTVLTRLLLGHNVYTANPT